LRYGLCLEYGTGVSIDFASAAKYYRLSADQGNSAGQWHYGFCLEYGNGVSIDLASAIEYYRLSADQGNPMGSSAYANCLGIGRGCHRDPFAAFRYSASAAEDNDAGACLMCAVAHQEGIGTPVDRLVSASYFQRAALLGDCRGANAFGKCLEEGIGRDADVSMAIRYYKMAAIAGDGDGANNYGLALEYGKCGVENAVQSAKYYKQASDHGHADGANNYGICLERGYGVKQDLEDAAKFYRLAAERGHADGMNNYGFCLEHGIGIGQDLSEARRYYLLAKQQNHAEAEVNYRRCSRLLGEWSVPLRNTTIENLNNDSFERCRNTVPPADHFLSQPRPPRSASDLSIAVIRGKAGGKLQSDPLREVTVYETPDGKRSAVKTLPLNAERAREIASIARFEHPCVLSIDGYKRHPDGERGEIVAALMENGSLDQNIRPREFARLRSPTKIAKIVAGVVLGMRFMHASGKVHGNLKPANLLLDRKWRVRIADFATSRFAGSGGDTRYHAPERFEGTPPSEAGDVYSFGLILYEAVIGERAFSPELRPEAVMRKILSGEELLIPESVEPGVARLIGRCCSFDCKDRPSFKEIFDTLEDMQFSIMPGVRPKKVTDFVAQIGEWEEKWGP
jgi:TPR repeat protein